MLGGPVSDATQWEQIEVVGDCASKVFEAMEREAAQGARIFQDATAVRLGSVSKEHRKLFAQAHAQGLSTPKARPGMHTTALAVQVGEHPAMLSDSSRRQAGDNLQGRLDQREAGLEKPLAMAAALSSTEVAAASRRIRCPCLAHRRRKVSAVEAVFPPDCQGGREVIRQVFDHDEPARADALRPEARLAYPQAQSQPLRDERKQWRATQIDARLVEPNRSLGNAIGDRRTPWQTRTRFLAVKGAPIDTNLAARVLQRGLRPRTNSRCYKSPHSASIASGLTSLMATGLYAGVNAVESLVALQEHRPEVFVNPAAWLPWASAASRAAPEATRRQSWALWARSGWPFQSNISSSRANRGTRASARWGHHAKRPWERRVRQRP